MIDLPRDLAPFRAMLGLFAPDLAEGLGRLLPRLALAIGPLRLARPTGDGDPDGFTGIARRGSYERLLLSEWLLADELPDEFLRRAAGGEHAFFQLARRAPARAHSSVALFDAGPAQLGGPRLAHLAALIVLAARAEQARARFAWGLLHRPDEPLLTEVTKESVTRLLLGRIALSPAPADVEAWAERARTAGWEDAWIVGGAETWPGWRHATLAVRDLLEPDRRALAVTARAPGGPPREVELDLPPDPAPVRLLRDPFAVAAPAPPRARGKGLPAPVSNLVFAANAAKVFARADTGEILAYPVPSSPSAGYARPKRYRPRAGGEVAAVGWFVRGMVMLVVRGQEIVLEHTGREGHALLHETVAVPPHLGLVPAERTGALAPLMIGGGHDGLEVIFTGAGRGLYRLFRERLAADRTGPTQIELLAVEVCALVPLASRCAFAGRGVVDGPLGKVGDDDRANDDRVLPVSADWRLVTRGFPDLHADNTSIQRTGPCEVCFGPAEGAAPRAFAAVRREGGRWTVFDDGALIAEREVPEGARVVGPWRPKRAEPPALVVLQPDQRTLAVTGPGPERIFPRAAAPIAHAVLATSRPMLAYVTTAGEVVIHALEREAVLVRYPCEAMGGG